MLSESALARLEDRLKVIQDRVRGVADHDYTGFYLHGPPGTSKTYTVRTHLDRLGTPHQYHSGHLTPLGLFDLLAEHPDEVILLDDVGHIFEQKVALQILLAALGSQPSDVGKRVVRYRRQADVRTVHFSGGVIFISNLCLHKAALLQALQSRVHCLHYDPSDEELAGLMLSISQKGWDHNGHHLTPAQCKEVAGFVISESQRFGVRLDLRSLDKGFRDYAQWDEDRAETNWKDLVRFTVEQQLSEPQHTPRLPYSRADRKESEQQIIRHLMNVFPDDRPRQLNEWMKQTGKSGRAFYRRLQEVGCDVLTSPACHHIQVTDCQSVNPSIDHDQGDDSLTD